MEGRIRAGDAEQFPGSGSARCRNEGGRWRNWFGKQVLPWAAPGCDSGWAGAAAAAREGTQGVVPSPNPSPPLALVLKTPEIPPNPAWLFASPCWGFSPALMGWAAGTSQRGPEQKIPDPRGILAF